MGKKAYVVDEFCFLQHPCGERGHWIRTDKCVAFVHCPECNAKQGELCLGFNRNRRAGVHSARRDHYTSLRREMFDDGSLKTKMYVVYEQVDGEAKWLNRDDDG